MVPPAHDSVPSARLPPWARDGPLTFSKHDILSFTWPPRSAVLAIALLSACGSDDCPTVRVCDVATRPCQESVMRAMRCMRGGDAKLPPVSVLDQAGLMARLYEGEESS